jgi:uncharacterized protein (DUF779 family)
VVGGMPMYTKVQRSEAWGHTELRRHAMDWRHAEMGIGIRRHRQGMHDDYHTH